MMFTIKTSETDLCFDLVKIYLSGVKIKPVTLPHAESPAFTYIHFETILPQCVISARHHCRLLNIR